MRSDLEKAMDALERIDPASLDYQEWIKVGMALKSSGASLSTWDSWSRRDAARHHEGEAERKWNGFSGSGISVGTLIAMAGPTNDYSFDDVSWDEPIIPARAGSALKAKEPQEDLPTIIDPRYVDDQTPVPAPSEGWEKHDLIKYLEAMFNDDELVAYVTDTWFNEAQGAYLPKKGATGMTSAELKEGLRKHPSDPGSVIGDYKEEAGAWIRINPMDGQGVTDANVTAYRHALLEADEDNLSKQLSIIRDLQLPCSAIVHSGKKSIHALVKVDAVDLKEYRQRVNFLFEVAAKNGLAVDKGNRNPSRLSRMPGVTRAGKPQYLIATHAGKKNWDEWVAWVEDLKDDLPEISTVGSFKEPPPMAPALIDGILRQGDKMLLAGPSKAGKSFDLLELALAIASGGYWHGFRCTQGKVLYVNLELNVASAINRVFEIAKMVGCDHSVLEKVSIWNLKGHAVPLNKLMPKLIRRSLSAGFIAVIIDPIYKVITGDENNAEAMSLFCNQFDRICRELGASAIYAHHHSKGEQGHKSSMDRASGSGVFARDPDALLDMIELNITEDARKALTHTMVINAMLSSMRDNELAEEILPPEALENVDKAFQAVSGLRHTHKAVEDVLQAMRDAKEAARVMAGFRIEATLREFARPEPRLTWFKYPIHTEDDYGILQDCKAHGEEPPWKKNSGQKGPTNAQKAKAAKAETKQVIEDHGGVGRCTVRNIAEALGISEDTVRKRRLPSLKLKQENGLVVPQ